MPLIFKKQRAMTMVEAVLALSFFGIVLGVAFMLCRVGWDSWSTNSARVLMTENLRKVQSWMEVDISQAGVSTFTDVPADGTWYHAVSFQKATGIVDDAIVWGSVMSYSLGGDGGKSLIRTSDAGSNPVSFNISAFDVRRQAAAPDLLEVHAATRQRTGRPAEEELTSTLDFTILIRN